MRKFDDIESVDFPCPVGNEWTKPHRKPLSFFSLLYEEIMGDEPSVELAAFAVQCKEMYDNPPKGLTCKTRKAFKNRWYKKLKYYNKELRNEKAIA